MNPLSTALSASNLKIRDLEKIYDRYGADARFRSWAIAAFDQLDPEKLWQPLWLLRRSLSESVPWTPSEFARLVEKADGFEHWIARLNFCQLVAKLKLPVTVRSEAAPLLLRCAEDRRPIIRAWAISGLYDLRADAVVGAPIRRLIARSKREKSKAMQARMRRLEQAT